MQTPWNPIFGYHLSDAQNSQQIYDEVFRLALNYKFNKSGLTIAPVDSKTLTEAIFSLNSHDQIDVSGEKIVNGQQLKELFITTIFLRFLERKIEPTSFICLALPHGPVGPIDTAIIVAKPGTEIIEVNRKTGRLPNQLATFKFQIKEYTDYLRNKTTHIIVPEPIDIEKLDKVAGDYSEIVFVYLNDFMSVSSDDVSNFFKTHPNAYLGLPFDTAFQYIPALPGEAHTQLIKPVVGKHNYIIATPQGPFAHITFGVPSCLVSFSF